MLNVLTRWSRRDLFRRSGLLALPALFRSDTSAAAPAEADGLRAGADIYRSIGVRPLINARGTFTIISGSLMLPEVRAAIAAAAQQHVHLDELMAAVGARLAELTRAEFGMVSSGCAAALTHATAACVAGGNPDLHVRIPNLAGFAKDEVIIPKHSRNVYDAAVAWVSAAAQPDVTRPHSACVSAARRAPIAAMSSSRCTWCCAAASMAARTSGSMREPLIIVNVPRALISGRTPIDW